MQVCERVEQDAPAAECEEALLRRARHEPAAFGELYRAYAGRLSAYAAYRTESAADAEDLVADAFLKAAESFQRFEYRGDGSFSAWLFHIAHNLLRDAGRRRERRGIPRPLEAAADIRAAGLLPEQAAVQQEEFARLHRLVAALPPRRHEIVALRFFAELRNREIAKVLGIGERSVASHLCRAIEDLHTSYLQETGDEPPFGSRRRNDEDDHEHAT